jgi:hypothetical protein
MASDIDDSDAAASRLEAALERIAQAAARDEAPDGAADMTPAGEEIAARLDGLIDRLRAAIGNKAD